MIFFFLNVCVYNIKVSSFYIYKLFLKLYKNLFLFFCKYFLFINNILKHIFVSMNIQKLLSLYLCFLCIIFPFYVLCFTVLYIFECSVLKINLKNHWLYHIIHKFHNHGVFICMGINKFLIIHLSHKKLTLL